MRRLTLDVVEPSVVVSYNVLAGNAVASFHARLLEGLAPVFARHRGFSFAENFCGMCCIVTQLCYTFHIDIKFFVKT
jgi:hypothetical protein